MRTYRRSVRRSTMEGDATPPGPRAPVERAGRTRRVAEGRVENALTAPGHAPRHFTR